MSQHQQASNKQTTAHGAIREMSGAQMVVQALKDQGVTTLFGYPGGAVLPIYDALYGQNDIKHILVRHEQGAAHSAEGYARSSGKVGVLLVTSGPGATNAITGLTDALLDSIPLVCITGQVPTHLIGTDAFQECDTVGITRHCTKHNYQVRSIADLPRILHEAFYVARSGRPGPVVVDIPKDVQFARGAYIGRQDVPEHKTYRRRWTPKWGRIEQAVMLMASAKRPVFYTGGGVINSGPEASKLLRELVALTGFPVTSTLMGLGCYPGLGAGVARHARHARDVRGQPRDARLRRDGEHRRALRRPHHRPARRLLARLAQDPRRHRSDVHQQDGARRRAGDRRLRPRAAGHVDALDGAQAQGRPGGPEGLVEGDRDLAGRRSRWASATRPA